MATKTKKKTSKKLTTIAPTPIALPEVPQLVAGAPAPTLKLDLAGGQNVREGFEGVDAWPGAQHVVNLFKFPWPWADSSVLELNCSHFAEHIPMIEVDEFGNQVPFGEGQDLWLRFFDECWRILVPDGWMTVVVPSARSNRAYQDPTHRRFHVAESFLYLAAEWRKVNKLDHYRAKCNFGVDANPSIPIEIGALSAEAQSRNINSFWNSTIDFHVKLKAIK